jgi:hypothetical protein
MGEDMASGVGSRRRCYSVACQRGPKRQSGAAARRVVPGRQGAFRAEGGPGSRGEVKKLTVLTRLEMRVAFTSFGSGNVRVVNITHGGLRPRAISQ